MGGLTLSQVKKKNQGQPKGDAAEGREQAP